MLYKNKYYKLCQIGKLTIKKYAILVANFELAKVVFLYYQTNLQNKNENATTVEQLHVFTTFILLAIEMAQIMLQIQYTYYTLCRINLI